jgi:hypothetical protein
MKKTMLWGALLLLANTTQAETLDLAPAIEIASANRIEPRIEMMVAANDTAKPITEEATTPNSDTTTNSDSLTKPDTPKTDMQPSTEPGAEPAKAPTSESTTEPTKTPTTAPTTAPTTTPTTAPTTTPTTIPAPTPTPVSSAPMNCDYKISAETKTVDPLLVTSWTEKAVIQAFDFDPRLIDSQMQKLQACFTEQGWQGFNTAIQKSGNMEAIKSQKLTVSSQIDGQTKLLETKENQWKLVIPLQVVYQNDKEKVTQLLSIDVTVSRKINGDLGIIQMIATPRTEEAAKPATPPPPPAQTTPAAPAAPETKPVPGFDEKTPSAPAAPQ